MSRKTGMIFGCAELGLAVLLGIISARAFKDAFFPSPEAHGEWSFLALIVFCPLALSFGVAGLTLLRDAKRKWLYQSLPFLVVLGIVVFLWWADRA